MVETLSVVTLSVEAEIESVTVRLPIVVFELVAMSVPPTLILPETVKSLNPMLSRVTFPETERLPPMIRLFAT